MYIAPAENPQFSSNFSQIPTDSGISSTCQLYQGTGHVVIQWPEVPKSIRKALLDTRKDNNQRNSHLLTRINVNNYSNSYTNRSHPNRSRSATARGFYAQQILYTISYGHRSQVTSSHPSPAIQ